VPNLGYWHPVAVHFAIALLVVGAVARIVSLVPLPERLRFTGPMATLLLLLGTAAAAVSVHTGHDAHGPVERVPGARAAVVEHEEWGEKTRNIFLVVAALEIAALVLRRRKAARFVLAASGLVGLAGLHALYEAGEHGGELVYSYAGGVGIRTGDTSDTRRLLAAALYHNAQLEREAGRGESAYAFFARLAERASGPVSELLRVESLLRDRKDPAAALAALAAWTPPDEERYVVRHGMLAAEALQAAGMPDSARARLTALRERYPENVRVREAAARAETLSVGRPAVQPGR
jgi:uncharacterized membrane protein